MNKQQYRFTSPLEGDNWKQRLTEFLAQDDASLEAKFHTDDAGPEIDPEPFYFVAPSVEARFDLPTNVLSALDAINPTTIR